MQQLCLQSIDFFLPLHEQIHEYIYLLQQNFIVQFNKGRKKIMRQRRMKNTKNQQHRPIRPMIFGNKSFSIYASPSKSIRSIDNMLLFSTYTQQNKQPKMKASYKQMNKQKVQYHNKHQPKNVKKQIFYQRESLKQPKISFKVNNSSSHKNKQYIEKTKRQKNLQKNMPKTGNFNKPYIKKGIYNKSQADDVQILKKKLKKSQDENNKLKIKIQEMTSKLELRDKKILDLQKFKKQSIQKQKQLTKQNFKNQIIPRHQNQKIQNSLNNNRFLSFFSGDVLEDYQQFKNYLTQVLQRAVGRAILKTKLLFRYDPLHQNGNIHNYIDKYQQIVLLCKTKRGYHFGGYYEGKLQDKGAKGGAGLIFSITNRRSYKLKPNKIAVVYDGFYLIFGNDEIRVKAKEGKATSNFGTMSSYYDSRGDRVDTLLGEGDKKQVELECYEVHHVIFS